MVTFFLNKNRHFNTRSLNELEIATSFIDHPEKAFFRSTQSSEKKAEKSWQFRPSKLVEQFFKEGNEIINIFFEQGGAKTVRQRKMEEKC